MILETARTYIRLLDKNDFDALYSILGDEEVMYAWEHAFSSQETQEWLKENLMRYERDGYSYFAIIEKGNYELIGVSGILKEKVDGKETIGIGYIFNKEVWKQGYAYECSFALIDYAFTVLNLDSISAQIRPNNVASIAVANKLGMKKQLEFIRNYRNKEILHELYVLENHSK